MLGGLTAYPRVANFLQCIHAKNYENWLAFDKVIAKIIRLTFLAHPVVYMHYRPTSLPRSINLVPIESAYRLCDFLLVRNSNFGPILHRFWATVRFMCSWPHPYSTLILGCSRNPVAPDRPWTLSYLAVKLFSKNSNLCDHDTWSSRTDRRTDDLLSHITALCAGLENGFDF